MAQTIPPADMVAQVERAGQTSARGGWLALARVLWAVVTLFELTMFGSSLGPTFALFTRPCVAQGDSACPTGQLPLADWRAIQAHGATPQTYAAFALSVVVVTSLIFFVVGLLIAWRKWGDLMGLFVSATLITFGSTGMSDTLTNGYGASSSGALEAVQGAIVLLSYPALATFMLTFPTGKFTPRWTALIIPLWIIQFGLFVAGMPTAVLLVSVAITWGSCIAVQVYRYRRVYTPTQRQQTKWVVFSLAIAVPVGVVSNALPALWPGLNTPGSLYRLSGVVQLLFFWTPISLGVGIAILRSRLYDIDLLINRALVYGLLTAILASLYAGGVIGGQRLISALTGASANAPQSPLSIVLTTLLVAALFQPLRHRLQAMIDRRFFRRKYDATRAVAAFSSMLRSEVNLPDLTNQLLGIVDDTMQPEHVSLWLRPRERPAPGPGSAQADTSEL